MMLIAMAGLFIFHDKTMIYVCIGLIGFGNSNVFSVVFSQALLYLPGKKNEVSGLMIMGLFGGTVFRWLWSSIRRHGTERAVAVMTVGVLYLCSIRSVLENNFITLETIKSVDHE